MKTKKKTNSLFLSVFICVHLWSVLFLFVCAGCKSKPKPTSEPLQPMPVMVPPGNRPTSRAATRNALKADSPLPATLAPPPRRLVRQNTGGPQDPKAPIQLGTRFDIYDILIPSGVVSRNEQFWKLVDEDKIDPGAYDVLRRNGVRVGIAPARDWPAMKDILDDSPSSTKTSSATGREASNIEIMLKHDVIAQSIFVFMPDRSMIGRTYERCDNLMALAFAQIPRKPGQVRVSMMPIVRSTRKQLTFSALGNAQDVSFTYPEKALDVSLRADVPLDHVLVVAPSDEASIASSLGRAFLMTDTAAEKNEHLLILVPRMFQIEDEKSAASVGPINGSVGR